jgi:hypothetical protein
MEMRMAVFFGIPALILIVLAIVLDNSIMMWVGVGFFCLAGAIFAFDQF